jgi:cytochrome P450
VQTDYIGTAISYIQALKKWPKSFRPFVYRYIEGYSTLRKQWNEGRAIVADFLAKKKANNWEPLQQPPSFFDIVASTNRDMSVDEHLSLQITFFVAGVHTSAATSTQALFDAAVNADCISQVRKEIQQLHASCGGVIERQHLSQLPKLDSFIKEVLRFSSPDLGKSCRIELQGLLC